MKQDLIEADKSAGDPDAPLEEREKAWEYLRLHGYHKYNTTQSIPDHFPAPGKV
jgi:hypothetical protein